MSIFKDVNPITMIDIGASGGVHPRWAKLLTQHKPVLCEPDQNARTKLLEDATSAGSVVLSAVLFDAPKEITLYETRKQECSSVFEPNVDFLSKYPDVERFDVVEKHVLHADTLDNQLQEHNLDGPGFLKIDAQGAELPILKGSTTALKSLVGLEVEVEFMSMYKGQPLFPDVHAFLIEQGFELCDLSREFWKRNNCKGYPRNKGQLVFADALYFRSPENLFQLFGESLEKCLHGIALYLLYGYVDFANTLYEQMSVSNHFSGGVLQDIKRELVKQKRFELLDFKGKLKIGAWLTAFTNRWFLSDRFYTGTDDTLGGRF